LGQSKSSLVLVFSLGGLDDGLFLISELLRNGLLLLLGTSSGVLLDFFVDLGVEFVNGVNLGILQAFVPDSELLLVSFSVTLDLLHVSSNVFTEDSCSVDLGVVTFLVTFLLEAGESLVGVGNVESSIDGTLEATENSVTSGGSDQTDIHECLEGSLVLAFSLLFNVVVFAVDGLGTSVKLVQTSGVEESSGTEKTSSVAGSIVGETSSEAVLLEFGGLGVAENSVTLDGGIDDLAENLLVGSSDNESVLFGVVLVLVLLD